MKISTTGDLGDCIYLLNILKHLPGGPHDLVVRHSFLTKAKTADKALRLFENLKALVSSQNYVGAFKVCALDERVDWCSEDFRKLRHFTPGETLMQAHLNHYCKMMKEQTTVPDNTPWLKVPPSISSKGRVVVNLTERYRNRTFPWQKVVEHYGELLMFVGLEHEWRNFCTAYGRVDFQPTENMLQVAELIAGSELFIGNQSSAFAIAEGLKHPRIQETDLTFPDCIFPTAEGYVKAQHVANGSVVLPAVGCRPTATFEPEPFKAQPMECRVVPPGMWQYPGCTQGTHLINVARELSKKEQIPMAQAEQMVYEYQRVRLPDFFRDTSEDGKFSRVQKALNRIQ